MTDNSAQDSVKAQWRATRERLRERWSSFRARSRYFQLRVLVMAAYALIVVLTALWAPPSSMERNDIGARILALSGDAVVGPYLIIENKSRDHWQHVSFAIDQGYIAERELVQAGEKVTLFVKDFHKVVMRTRRGRQIPKKVAAPVDLPLSKLVVTTTAGQAIAALALEKKAGS